MYNFSEERQKSLELVETVDLKNAEYPFDFYYTPESPDHELSSELIMKMFEFKTLLDNAEINTQWRIQLFRQLVDCYLRFDEELSICNSKLFAITYYLSNEINWLQREPLVFRDFRELLAEIAYKIAILDVLEFSEKIKKNNDSVSNPAKLAARYKYAAISLLRSTNKLKFCQSISQIINSTWKKDHFSNTLTQNTFYHIYSLYKNKYNKSKKYFTALSDQLNKLIEDEARFSRDQKAVLTFLDIHNNVFYIASDLKVVKSLKKYFKKFYTTNHPYPDTCMRSMNLSDFDKEGLKNIEEKRTSSVFYNYFNTLAKDLLENWIIVSNYIHSYIEVHTEKLSDGFKRSTFFQSLFADNYINNIFDGNYILGVTDEFSQLVRKINENPLLYLEKKSEYDALHNKIYNNIIARKDSVFQNFLKQFPCNSELIINDIFKPAVEKTDVEINTTKLSIFYPASMLKDDFKHVLQNIEKRLKPGCTLRNINLKIIISEEVNEDIDYTVLNVSYDSTSEPNPPSESGGLTKIKNEIKNFGGIFDFGISTYSKDIFTLKFKFISYE